MYSEAPPTVRQKSSVCQGIARTYLYIVNVIVFLAGQSLFAISVFVAVVQGDLVAALGEAGIIGPIVAGVFLMLTSILGCCGVRRRNKFLMITYLLLTTTLASAFLGVGALFTFTVENLDNIDGLASNTLSDKVESRLNDVLIAVFNECCADQFELDERLLGCSDPNANLDACFTFEETYQAALDRVKNSQLCVVLESIEVNGVPVVGDPAEITGACAGGDGVAFKLAITEVVEDALVPAGGAFLGLGSILLLTMLSTVCVLCARKNEIFEAQETEAKNIAMGDPMQPPPIFPPTTGEYSMNPKYNATF